MVVDSSQVKVELMVMKKFKKDTGYDALMLKLYDKVKKGKPKSINANVQIPKITFTPAGKEKPKVPVLLNTKVKQVKKGPAKDKIIVVAAEGDAKKKILILALRFATEEGAKLFYDATKAKGVPTTETDYERTPTPAPPPPPAVMSRAEARSITLSTTSSTSSRNEPARRDTYNETPLPVVQPNLKRYDSVASSASHTTINDMSARPIVPPPPPPPSTSVTPLRPQTRTSSMHSAKPRARSISSSSSSSSSTSSSAPRKSAPEPASKSASRMNSFNYTLESRTTFISTDPNSYKRPQYDKNYWDYTAQKQKTRGNRSGIMPDEADYRPRRSRSSKKTSEPVRIFKFNSDMPSHNGESGRMCYFSSKDRSLSTSGSRDSNKDHRRVYLSSSSSSSSSSSRSSIRSLSSSSSTSSNESIASRWMHNQLTGRNGRDSTYKIRNRGDFIEMTPRSHSMGPGSRKRNVSSSSSSSLTSYSSSSSESANFKGWRIRRKSSTSSSSASSSSSSSSSHKGKYKSKHKHRSHHHRVIRAR